MDRINVYPSRLALQNMRQRLNASLKGVSLLKKRADALAFHYRASSSKALRMILETTLCMKQARITVAEAQVIDHSIIPLLFVVQYEFWRLIVWYDYLSRLNFCSTAFDWLAWLLKLLWSKFNSVQLTLDFWIYWTTFQFIAGNQNTQILESLSSKARIHFSTHFDNIAGVRLLIFDKEIDPDVIDRTNMVGLARGAEQLAICRSAYGHALDLIIQQAVVRYAMKASSICLSPHIQSIGCLINQVNIDWLIDWLDDCFPCRPSTTCTTRPIAASTASRTS